jgi:uncharacterized NAD-dependent epimerase/dehydratase family protein
MVRRVFGVLGVVSVLGLSGCSGSAVLIASAPDGGLLALDGDHEQAMSDARRQMSDSCNGAYTVVSGRNVVAGVYRGRAINEYQIRYVCGAHPDRQFTPSPDR